MNSLLEVRNISNHQWNCNYEFLQEKLNIIVHLTVAQTFWKPDISDGIADFFWICGGESLLPFLPIGWKGICVRVRLLQEINMAQWGTEQSTNKEDHRIRRGYEPDPKVYIDPIGQPRGFPNEFNARNEVKAGFESIFVWISAIINDWSS